MTKRVLDVGNCGFDHSSLVRLIEDNFDAKVVQAHGSEDALAELQGGGIDLVLVNRKLDRDHSDGLEIIRQIKQDRALSAIPCMLITNFAEHQESAVQAGAELGFGKSELGQPQAYQRLREYLG